ncbi:2-amino-4-hydroxy-6-hydroxymethyldihydropteridine diphosphokinase [bacterium]|nr:2-amino-4-hydroxy-6-hydroxymethyldihydropteridine diphosphokinase [bacterium]
MPEVFLGLGANLENPVMQLRWCVQTLAQDPDIEIQRISSLYRTTPLGCEEPQPDYYNAVVSITTEKSPKVLLKLSLGLEAEIGRERAKKNAPRLLDVDLLLYNNEIISEPDLRIPHQEMTKRAFVLVPLAEIAPEVQHPEVKQSIAALLAQIPTQGTYCVAVGPDWAKLNEE